MTNDSQLQKYFTNDLGLLYIPLLRGLGGLFYYFLSLID